MLAETYEKGVKEGERSALYVMQEIIDIVKISSNAKRSERINAMEWLLAETKKILEEKNNAGRDTERE